MRHVSRTCLLAAATAGLLLSRGYGQLPVADPEVWLRADVGVVEDGAGGIERWEDQSGNGHDFEQTQADKRPILEAEGWILGEGELVGLEPLRNGNSTYSGVLSIDFVVDEEVEIRELAAFDHLRDGITGEITVKLWSRPDNGTPRTAEDDLEGTVLEQLTFNAGDPGELIGSYRWKPLAAPRTLSPGSYSLTASGFTGSDYYYSTTSSTGIHGPTWRGIQLPPQTRYGSNAGAWPTTLTSPGFRYGGSANLRFSPTGDTPDHRPAVVFDGVDDGLLGGETLNLARPSTVWVVSRIDDSSFGYLLQNTSGNPWTIRSDGYYSQGWVRFSAPGWGVPWVAGMVSTATDTRAIWNLDDVTSGEGLVNANPGRLALGGGEGRSNDPVAARVVEVVAFDRQLSTAELRSMQKYFGDRYGIYETPAATPEMVPPGDFGTGDVDVTLSSDTVGAEIRYTLDGSDPDGSSALYGAAIRVPRGTEVRARAYLAGTEASGVAAQFYGDEGSGDLPPGDPVAWLKGDSGLALDSSGGVLRWSDLTGNGNDFLQGTASVRPKVEGLSGSDGVAIRTIHGDEGSYNHTGTLGSDFVVTEEIEVSALAAFDHRSDGFASPVTVQLLVRDDHGTPVTPGDDSPGTVLAEMEFSPSEPGDLSGPFRVKSLAAPVTLAPGSYSILAWGYTGANFYANSSDGGWREDGIEFVQQSRYGSTPGVWPTSLDSHPVKYNGAGNFVYQPTAGSSSLPAVSFDGTDDGMLARATSVVGRPSSVFFTLEYEDDGRFLQSASGSWWVRGTDRYANGTVSGVDLPRFRTLVGGMTSSSEGTRFYVDGEEWTENPGLTTPDPGRLALGGGVGYGFDPAKVRIAEVLAYERVLDAGERWEVQQYLAERQGQPVVPLPEVAIEPPSHYGTGNVTVSLDHAVEGVEIHYTLDGTAPTVGSPLFGSSLEVPRGTRVRARAYAAGGEASGISEAFYGLAEGEDDLPVAGAGLWLRADAGVTTDSEGRVARWADLSGGGRDLVQTVLSKRPAMLAEPMARGVDQAIVIDDIAGASTWAGTLGEDFVVEAELEVTHLGAFDHLKDGFAGTVTVELWSRDDGGTPQTPGDDSPGVMLAQRIFTQGNSGELSGGIRYQALDAPISLEPGDYTVLAYGYSGQDLYREGSYSVAGGDGRFEFVNVSRYSTSLGSWPGSLDNRALDYTGAATFRFTPVVPTAAGVVAFDGVDDGMLAVDSVNFGRPSTVLMAFELAGSQFGYLLQNQVGNPWQLRTDGYYVNGWVLYENFGFGHPLIAGVVNDGTETRVYRNGDEVTVSPSLVNANPGRLTLGGGEGRNIDPSSLRVAEVIAFDRVLDAEELERMSAYLSRRHRNEVPMAPEPRIDPLSNYGSGEVTVTLSTSSDSVQIRYTTDGGEPDGSSSLYSGPFVVARGTEVKALAMGSGWQPSDTVSTYYGDASQHPLPVTDPGFWIRADRGIELDGNGGVRRWRDLSGHGRDVVQADGGQAPRWVEHGFGGSEIEVAPKESGRSVTGVYSGWIGTDFIVEETIELMGFSVFDSAGDGFAEDIVVRLHRLDDGGTPDQPADDSSAEVMATLTFTPGEPGFLDRGKRRLNFGSPLSLVPGRYFLESQGWNGANTYESSENFSVALHPSLTFPAVSRYGTSTAIPGSRVGDNRYLGSAGFVFRVPGTDDPAVPSVRFDGDDDGMLGPVDYLVGRPSTVFMVYQQAPGTRGRLLQSGSGNNWLLGLHGSPQGYYADGWITQHSIRANVPSLSVAVQETSDSRYFYNGVDLTTDANPLGNLGRIAVGGGEGTYFQPTDADLVELIVYDRVLEPEERQAVSASIGVRYGLSGEPLLPVVMSPAGGLFASGRSVTLSHPTPGVEIRYTLDGSDPDESSALYGAPFLVNQDRLVLARAFAPGQIASEITEGAFFIDAGAPTPPQRESMLVWLRGAVGAEVDGSSGVEVWRDLSGKGHDAAQSAEAQRPLWMVDGVGGAPGLEFDGANDFLQLPEGFDDFDDGFTAMFVVRPNEVGNWQRFVDLSRGVNFANIFVGRYGTTGDFTYDLRGSNGSGNLRAADTIQPLGNAIFTVSQLADGSVKLYKNGSLVAEDATFPLPQNILRTVNLIGKSPWSSDAYYSGTMAEVVIYQTALGDLERETFEQEIRAVYGIASTSAGTVAFSPSPASLYPSGVEVVLSSVTEGAEIRYTLDGSTPDELSALYVGPISLSGSARVRARAFAEGFNASAFSEATYLIGQPPSSGDGLLGTYFDNEDFTGSSLTRVDPNIDFAFSTGSPDPAIQPDTFSVRWTGRLIPRFSEDYTFFTSQDDGMRVWVDLDRSGTFEDGSELLINDFNAGGTRERVSAAVALEAGQLYEVKVEYWESTGNAVARLLWSSFSEPKAAIPQSQWFSDAEFSQTVATPVITPTAGTYNEAVEVSMATATSGATLYFTTDGSEPTTASQVYTGSFMVGASTTVRARGFKAGFNPSGVANSAFTIDAQPPVIETFTWDGIEITPGETFTAAGVLETTATDNQGVVSASFYYLPEGTSTPILIGTDTSPSNGLRASWNIGNVSDGSYSVRVRVYDTSGTFSEVTRAVDVALAVPDAPTITEPLTGVTIEEPVVNLRVSSLPNANLRVYRDDVFLFSGYANSSGVMTYAASLPTGTSQFHAVARNRAGNSDASNRVQVTRVREFPALGLSFDNNTVGEGVPVTGTVSIPVAEASDVTVQITTSIPSRMESVPPVVIPAGSTQANFTLVGRVDAVIQLLPTLYVTATASEHQDAVAALYLADSPYPEISLELDEVSVSEDVGSVIGRVRRAAVQNVPLRVYLTRTGTSKVQVPSYVTIPGGTTVTSFTASITDNAMSDGNATATLGAEVRVGDTAVAAATTVSLEVRDDDGPVLSFASPKPLLNEGAAVNFTLRRQGGDPTSGLTVSLSQSPGSDLSLPASVQFSANVTEMQVPVSVPVSSTSGTRLVTARASAAGYVDGLAQVSVSDVGLPDLVPAALSGPTRVLTEQSFTVNYTIHNYGPAAIEQPFLERVLLSLDPTPSADDIVVRQVEQNGTVLAEGSYGRNLSIFAPRAVGDYYLVVTVDPGLSVTEISETNNTAVSALPIQVRAAYSATVQTDAEVIPANTPVTFYGSATKDGGTPAAFSMVNIHIESNGTERVIAAVTNSLGEFSTVWNPLQNEGGLYTIGASHPGLPSAPQQDHFEILTMGFDPPGTVRLNEGETVVANAVVRNPNGRDLTDLQVTLGDLPTGLTVTPQLTATTVPAGEELVVPLTISAANGFSGSGRFPLTATTDEGVSLTVGLSVRADLLVPVLSIQPGTLTASVLRGGTQSVSFTVTNTGGLASGSIQVLLPDIPWMSLASSATLPSLAPGATAGVSLQLAPGSEVDLTQYSGNLALNAQNGGSRSIPYRFRVVSDLTGDLQVKVVDELYYFTEAAPALEGAEVVLRDAISSAVVARSTTGVDGTVQFDDVPEAWYRLEVSADRHDRYSNNYFLMAGEQSEELVFISKQLVNYTWTVEEVEIEDVYRITVETTFETNVPAPVVTISPARIDVDDLVALGQSKVVNLTLTNQGFIAANEGLLDFSDHPFYEFTPLVKNVGTIPAKSSLVVPVTIRRVGVFDEEGNIVLLPEGAKTAKGAKLVTKAGGSVPCGAGGKFNYSYPCGPENPSKSAPIAVSGVQGNCGGSGGSSGGYIGFHGGYFSGGGGGGGGGGGSASGSAVSFASADACDPCVQQAILECLIGFTPLGCPYSIGKCIYQTGDAVFGDGKGSDAGSTCLESAIGCAADAVPIPGLGAAVNGFFCIKAVMGCGTGGGGGAGGGGGSGGDGTRSKVAKEDANDLFFVIGSPWTEALSTEVRSYAAEVAPALSRSEAILDYFAVIFGTRERLLLVEHEEVQLWGQQFFARALASSEGGIRITANERIDLETFASMLEADQQALLGLVVERWNRTLDYAELGIYEVDDVPEGGDLDFIQDSRLKLAAEKMVSAYDTSRELGYADPMEETGVAIRAFQQTILEGQGGVCSRVKIEISQDLVMTRTAFDATLVLENERDDVGVSEIGFDLQIRDANGLPSDDLFNIQVTKLVGLGAIDGTGSLDAATTGSAKWTLIPRDTAALTEAVQYTVGGVITYTQDGTEFIIPVENVPITVRPDASLALKYFHQRDVFSDDPYTDAIEPAIPYKLAVMVENHGFGPARDLKIISGQPQIVENEKGLFIDFKIIGTEVDGQSLSPSLTAEFGDLEPGDRSIATFYMTSTLQGLFIDYDATFEHVTGLGDPRISLLESVEIHEMIHSVYAFDGGHDDSSPDFLTNDVADVNDYPDTIHYSDGGTDLVTVKESGTFAGTLGGGSLTLTLDVGAFTGWTYIRVPDPAQGAYRLASVERADGRMLPIDFNAWQTDRTFIGAGRRPIYEHILHLADSESSGVYTLTYQPKGPADVTAPTSSVMALAAQSVPEIPVFWTGSDDQGVAFYDVYVSANGAPFTLWRSRVTETAGIYPGTPGETYAFYSVATDSAGNRETKSAVAEATTTALAENAPPVIASIPNQNVAERSVFTYQATATDPDGAGSLIRWSLGSSVPGITIDPVTGLIRWNTGETDGGRSVSVVVVATDAGSPPAVGNEGFLLTVSDVNDPPVISQVGPQTLQAGGVLIVDVDATDGDSPQQSLTYSLVEAPVGASIHPTTGVIQWSAGEISEEETHLFQVAVSDSGSPQQSAVMSFSVVVQPSEDTDLPPAFTQVPVVLWVKGSVYQVNVVAVDPDGDAVSLSAQVSTTPGGVFADLGSGQGRFSWDTTEVDAGTYQVPLTATANGKSASAVLRVRIAEDELYWNWVKESFGDLAEDFDLALLEMDADPDGDGRTNLHEMVFLTQPLGADAIPLRFGHVMQPPFITTTMSVHRRVGSDAYVQIYPRWGDLPGPWQRVPVTDYSATIDADGDDDGRPESERIDFQLFEYFPDGLPATRFYQVESVENP
ncbi:hypothetical protein HNR46_003492 [Haloferula luteola]|uniref:Uncharacterized protein n=1 Tax=Haloferula luteola TaxID=595692 RepID=A0A840V4N0_9BACT|nr:chitobiase/beta-hexosaminidase C-terminal domain-containing protein [Haloferula luteola]MBB5353237.1 hypothetical protein [Haloferula luteola]